MTQAPKRQPIPFGKYLLLDRVNIGGMAEVWRAKTFGAGGFERLVAIKRILPNIAEDEEFITMFIDEAKITVQLAHANVAQIYELNNISNNYFIAMEYVSGKDMRAIFDRCRKRGEPAPIPLVCHLISRCCEGLDYAHRKKDGHGRDLSIVHRDVSPQNAIVSYDGEVKVIDFGIAKAAGKATKTQAGILKGKFGYMSPEQIRGLPLDRRSDVFAIGVCLYEMLTGERLFVGDSDFSVLEKVRKVEVLPPSHFNRRIPDPLEKIVMKALAKDVDDRYQWASDLAEDLNRFIYSSNLSFGRTDLASFMRATFAEDYEKEKGRIQEYMDVKAPAGMVAAMEMGLQAGPVPVPSAPAPNPSAVTNVPTMAPPQVRASSGSLPPVARPSTPGLSPGASNRPPTANMPRLTAVAPRIQVEKEEHNSTVLVDGSGQVLSGPELGLHSPFDEESVTDAGRPALQPEPDTGTSPAIFAPPPAQVHQGANAWQNNRPGPPVLTASSMALPQVGGGANSAPTLLPVPQGARPSAPVPGADFSEEVTHGGSGGKSKGLIIGGALAIVLAIGGVGAAFYFKPPPHGLVMVDIPAGLEGKVRLNINGKEVLEEDGTPLKSWPQIRDVPSGRATIMLKCDGYDTLVETVQINEGNEVTQLTKKLKKRGEPSE